MYTRTSLNTLSLYAAAAAATTWDSIGASTTAALSAASKLAVALPTAQLLCSCKQ
jgi:hypothetical protein